MAERVIPLETERLILRGHTVDDAADIYEYAQSPLVGPAAGWKPHESLEESRQTVDFFNSQYAVFAIVLKDGGKVIGSVGLIDNKQLGGIELGYALSADYWGRGIMTEAAKRVIEYAFNELGEERLFATHFPDNGRSKRVIEKCGFTFEKRIEDGWLNYDGRKLAVDKYVLSRR